MTGYLIIDTSTRYGAVGLWDGGIERLNAWRSHNNHTAELMPAVDALLQADAILPGELMGIVVAIGPGGFSALRTGLGVAKGLAVGGSLPLVGVSSLEASAYTYRNAAARICALLPAGRQTVAWSTYASRGDSWRVLNEERVSSCEEFLALQEGQTLFCGEGAGDLETQLLDRLGESALFTDTTPLSRLVGAAEIGVPRIVAGQVGLPDSIEPRYLRPPGITQPNKPSPVRYGGGR